MILLFAAAASAGPLTWSSSGPPAGAARCVQLLEGADPHTWADNYLCSADELGLRWSSAGPIRGAVCTQLFEPMDPHTWTDNYLCVDVASPYALAWSFAGPLPGWDCTQMLEAAEPAEHTWSDNYICTRPLEPPAGSVRTRNR